MAVSANVKLNKLTRELRELIAALDRRIPRVEQAGEVAITRDAAVLREKAVQRLRQLDQQAQDRRRLIPTRES